MGRTGISDWFGHSGGGWKQPLPLSTVIHVTELAGMAGVC
jgi:hypothetical protein